MFLCPQASIRMFPICPGHFCVSTGKPDIREPALRKKPAASVGGFDGTFWIKDIRCSLCLLFYTWGHNNNRY